MKKAFWIAKYKKINSQEGLNKYSEKAKKIIETFGGKALVRGGISVIIEPRSEFLLQGTMVDYEKGLYEEKFVFNTTDTNKKSKCGCGKSFSI